MNDVLRYTTTFDESGYYTGIERTLSTLQKQGYKIEKVYDGWKLRTLGDKDTGYRGINVTLKDAKGQEFELQFHTKKSFDLKTKNHPLYEEWRNPNTPKTRKDELVDIQIKEAEKIPLPDRVNDVSKMIERFIEK